MFWVTSSPERLLRRWFTLEKRVRARLRRWDPILRARWLWPNSLMRSSPGGWEGACGILCGQGNICRSYERQRRKVIPRLYRLPPHLHNAWSTHCTRLLHTALGRPACTARTPGLRTTASCPC